MSLAMRQAKYAQGDPGLFGFLGKAIGTVTGLAGGLLPGPLGIAARGISGLLTPKPISVAKAGAVGGAVGLIANRLLTPKMAPISGGLPILNRAGSGVSIGPGGVQVGTFAPAAAPAQQRTTGALVGTGQGTPCTAGYHYNKTDYYTKRYGVVEKGSVCVKNRRRNPLNPRALSRAMSRVKSAQKAVKCLQLFAGPAARASAKGGGRRRVGKARCNGKCR